MGTKHKHSDHVSKVQLRLTNPSRAEYRSRPADWRAASHGTAVAPLRSLAPMSLPLQQKENTRYKAVLLSGYSRSCFARYELETEGRE